MTGGTFGFGNRDRVGPEGGARATGTVVLPIQSGIKDQNGADWGDNRMNALDVAKASVALGLLGDEAEEDDMLKKLQKQLVQIQQQQKKLLSNYLLQKCKWRNWIN